MRNIKIPLSFLIVGLCIVLFHSCNTCSRQQKNDGITIDLADLAIDSTYVNMAKKVFYALPTPIEMSVLIKNSGIQYQASLLNNPSNASKYLTHSQMAVNFGAYITDLVYAGLFEQTQTMLRYKIAIQMMIDGLGMTSAVDHDLLKQLETNINNKDEVLKILSETYASCAAYLNEEDRYFLTVAILVGGWIEGMYIASSLTNENLLSIGTRVEQLVIDQKLTFDMMWQVMSDLKDIPEIAALMSEMSGLAKAFDRIQIDQTNNQVSFDETEQATVLKSVSLGNVDTSVFVEIKNEIQTIRHNFTK
ncbi:MAG: hypothetical protein LBQ60_04795 [Bacteroidales bacterium]|jgi:hypothetical protein|nr:hypothetical protein [Bacteroidales bacterium]